MTITPPRGAGGTTTRSTRNRNRRRLNTSSSAGEPRHAAVNQAEVAPARRRGGRHAAADETNVPAAELIDVEFPAPAWDPWATSAGQATTPAGRGDALDASGVVDSRAFWGAEPAPVHGTGWTGTTEAGSAYRAWTDTTGTTERVAGDELAFGTGWIDGAATGSGFHEAGPGIGFDGPADVPGLAGEDTGTPAAPLVEPDENGSRRAYRKEDRKRRGGLRAHGRRPRISFLGGVVARCALYLGPLSVAVAAAEPLGRVAWPVPAMLLLLGWTAAQGLSSVGMAVASRGGPSAAARLVAAGFALVITLWCMLVWVAPASLLGPDRALAATVGIGGLLTLAAVTAALVTRSEGAVAGWFVPCWLLAATVMAESAGVAEAALAPVETMLPAGIVAAAIRAFRPAALVPMLSAPAGRKRRPTAADRRRGLAYMIIGAAQAVCVALLWRGAPAVMPLPAALPLVVAVPLLEGLIGWHTARIDAALDSAETPAEFDRHIRGVTTITLAGLLPPLAAGCALLVAAYRLPHGFAVLPGARAAVLALAAGTLLGGVFAVTFLLAARSRHGIAATLATIPPLAAAVLAVYAPPAGMFPAAVAVLAATHLAGLLIVALTAADLRRTP